MNAALPVHDLGRMPYSEAYEAQCAHRDRLLAARESPDDTPAGVLLLVEHDPPVITVSRRPAARQHLIATDDHLKSLGVEVHQTDRGGDITYHGPGQLVVYPIVDLNRVGLGLHEYMRRLEHAVIDACKIFGVDAHQDSCATGVWVGDNNSADDCSNAAAGAKICAIGIRVRRWVTTHGLALNVCPDLSHFSLIVPCGLPGRPVTSLREQLGESCPTMTETKHVVVNALRKRLLEQPNET